MQSNPYQWRVTNYKLGWRTSDVPSDIDRPFVTFGDNAVCLCTCPLNEGSDYDILLADDHNLRILLSRVVILSV